MVHVRGPVAGLVACSTYKAPARVLDRTMLFSTVDAAIREFFDRYADCFNRALVGQQSMDEVGSLYAAEFIAASPLGVMAGKNDEQFKHVMSQGYEHYRAIGTKDMRVRGVRVSGIDDLHCLAHVAWTATYVREGRDDVAIDFEVHYLMQVLGGAPKVFGWVAGNEQEVLKEHGIV